MNEANRICEEIDAGLKKMRNRSLYKLIFLYRKYFGLMPVFIGEMRNPEKARRYNASIVTAKNAKETLNCSERTAYDYILALSLIDKVQQLETETTNALANSIIGQYKEK